MKEEHLFPIQISDEERAAGFHLVETRLPMLDSETFGVHSSTVVAVLPLATGVRLIKMLDMMALPGESSVGYQLQVYGIEASLADKSWNKPKWDTWWDGLSKSFQAALARYQRDGIPRNVQLAEPPEEVVVPQWPLPGDAENA